MYKIMISCFFFLFCISCGSGLVQTNTTINGTITPTTPTTTTQDTDSTDSSTNASCLSKVSAFSLQIVSSTSAKLTICNQTVIADVSTTSGGINNTALISYLNGLGYNNTPATTPPAIVVANNTTPQTYNGCINSGYMIRDNYSNYSSQFCPNSYIDQSSSLIEARVSWTTGGSQWSIILNNSSLLAGSTVTTQAISTTSGRTIQYNQMTYGGYIKIINSTLINSYIATSISGGNMLIINSTLQNVDQTTLNGLGIYEIQDCTLTESPKPGPNTPNQIQVQATVTSDFANQCLFNGVIYYNYVG